MNKLIFHFYCSPVVKLVLQEVLLPFLQQLTLGVRSAVAEKLFRIAVTWLGEKSSLLEIPGEKLLLKCYSRYHPPERRRHESTVYTFQHRTQCTIQSWRASHLCTACNAVCPNAVEEHVVRGNSTKGADHKSKIAIFNINLVVKLKEGGLGDPVLVKEADLWNV